MKTTIENHNLQKCKTMTVTVWYPVSADTSIMQFLYLRLRDHGGREERKIAITGAPGNLL